MSLTTRVGLLAGACTLTLTGAGYADNTTEAQDYEARIAELEARVAQLTGDNWMTETRADEIRGLVEEVLTDADTRASLLQSGMTSGYDGGFMLGSSDGSFSLRLNGQLQTRFMWNNQDDMAPADGDRWGFENTRTKLMFSGNVGGPDWMYYVEGDFRNAGGGFSLDDAWIGHDFGNGWNVKMGQFKAPLNREFLVHSSNQLAAERSNVSGLFNGGRTQGIVFGYADDQWNLAVSYNDGAGTGGTSALTMDTEVSFTARGEILLSGNWDQFEDFTSKQGSEQGMMAGLGFHYQKGEYGTAAGPETELWILSGDFSWEMDGANMFASFSYSDNDTTNVNPWGFVVQGGYYFNETLEGFVRYEYADFDSAMASVDDLSIITVGVNAYYTENVKMTADIGFGTDGVNAATFAGGANALTGWRTDGGTDDGQIVVRTQLQLVF